MCVCVSVQNTQRTRLILWLPSVPFPVSPLSPSPPPLILPLSFPELLPCWWAIRSDHYFEAQTGCLDTGRGDELSRSISGSRDGAAGPRPPSHPHLSCSGLRCCFLHLLGMTKVPRRQTPVKNISIHGFRPVKDEEQHFDTESRLKGSVFVWVLSAAARKGQERNRRGGKEGRGEKERSFFHILKP